MLQPRSIQSSLGMRDKILSLDYVLVISILVLGIVSMFAMYSTDGGEFKYHTNSHILRFFVFFAELQRFRRKTDPRIDPSRRGSMTKRHYGSISR